MYMYLCNAMTSQSPSANRTSDCLLTEISPEALGTIAEFFKTLSEVSRLQIVCSLKQGEKNVSEIIQSTELGQANVSKHLKILSQAGLVERRQQGVNVYYRIANPVVFSLCDLACDVLALHLEQQSQSFESMKLLKNTF
jgi:DNA-binding transcriptional ArsR family regulator